MRDVFVSFFVVLVSMSTLLENKLLGFYDIHNWQSQAIHLSGNGRVTSGTVSMQLAYRSLVCSTNLNEPY